MELMARFAERTGLVGDRPQRRYLWTDAYAVCNFVTLGERGLALELIDRVHRVLGRGDAEHPTRGGLRIGKPLPERAAGEPLVERLEWDRDGQYFHYLTKWMGALDAAAHGTDDEKLARWARELADTAHRAFVYGPPGHRRMYWKMSIDLTRPQVASMGHHDPLDGYITCLQLGLDEAAADYRTMIDPHGLATADPLGLGGLLYDAYRLTRIDRDRPLRDALLAAARVGLEHYAVQPDLRLGAEHRLAFRELGLAIGLAAADQIGAKPVARYAHVRAAIEGFWRDPDHRRSRTYREHEDINDVMLATALIRQPLPRAAGDGIAIRPLPAAV